MQTLLCPTLDQAMAQGRNLVWCGTLQLAWNDLMDLAGGAVEVTPRSSVVDALNRRPMDRSHLPEGSYLVAAGPAADVLPRLRRDMARHFAQAQPDFLDDLAGLPPSSLVTYGFLQRACRFPQAFRREAGMEFVRGLGGQATPGRVDYFTADQASAVRILWLTTSTPAHQEPAWADELIVEFQTVDPNDRLILAAIDPEQTLGQTVSIVMERVAAPNTRPLRDDAFEGAGPQDINTLLRQSDRLLADEEVRVPVVRLERCESFNELIGLQARLSGADSPRQEILLAQQRVAFELNEEGASVQSEAALGLFGGPVRELSFDRPFLILLARRDADRPYLAIWVDNPDVLVSSN